MSGARCSGTNNDDYGHSLTVADIERLFLRIAELEERLAAVEGRSDDMTWRARLDPRRATMNLTMLDDTYRATINANSSVDQAGMVLRALTTGSSHTAVIATANTSYSQFEMHHDTSLGGANLFLKSDELPTNPLHSLRFMKVGYKSHAGSTVYRYFICSPDFV